MNLSGVTYEKHSTWQLKESAEKIIASLKMVTKFSKCGLEHHQNVWVTAVIYGNKNL